MFIVIDFVLDLDICLCWNIIFVICLLIVNFGFNEESGFWKIIEIFLFWICCNVEVDKLFNDCLLKIIFFVNVWFG